MEPATATYKRHACPPEPEPGTWRRREPEKTVLYQIVQANLKTFLEFAENRDPQGRGLPKYVRNAFEAYLECGIIQHGFIRVRCPGCGHDGIVPFSCKQRGVCPSCAARRMSDTAAHLVDRVFPRVPVRQWVLSLPRPMRYVLARDAKLLSRALKIFVSEIFRHLKRKAGHRPASEVLTGAVTGIQRYGGAINLNPHLHTLALDGVYIWDDEAQALKFKPLPEPSDEELHDVLRRTRTRIRAFLASKGFTAFEPSSSESGSTASDADFEEPSLFDTVQSSSILEQLTLSGSPRRVPMEGRRELPFIPSLQKPLCVSSDGFSLEAGVRIRKGDREGLERLCRYVTRPPISLERLELLPDGRVRYGLRRPRPDGSTHLILTPLEFMEKIAALVPPPRHHLTVYHGILAPNSRARSRVVPPTAPPPPEAREEEPCDHPRKKRKRRRRGEKESSGSRDPDQDGEAPRSQEAPTGAGRTPWATLLRRTFALDVLQCPKCKGRMEVIAAITEPEAIRSILRCLGHPVDPPRAAPARPLADPGFEFDQAS